MSFESINPSNLRTRFDLELVLRMADRSDYSKWQQMLEDVLPRDYLFHFLPAPDLNALDPFRVSEEGDHLRYDLFFALSKDDELTSGAVLARDVTTNNAELVMAIRNSWKGHGIGGSIFEYAIHLAKARGVKILWSVEELANPSGLQFARDIGFSAHPLEDEPGMMRLEMAL